MGAASSLACRLMHAILVTLHRGMSMLNMRLPQRGKVPIVAGGTGFYLRWYVHGRPSTPAASPQAAQQVQDMLQQARPSQFPTSSLAIVIGGLEHK